MQRVFYRDKDWKVEEGIDLPRLRELLKASHPCLWVDLEGEPSEALEAVAREFGLHPVTIEDLVHRNQRPKLEEFDSYIFIVTHGLRSIQGEEVVTDEFNFALGDNWILSAHDGHVEAMKRVYDQVVATPKAFDGGASFILYRMSDLLVDSYFPALDALEEQTDTLEDDVVQRPTQARLQQIFALKRVLVHLRKLVSPQREVYNALSRRDHPYIDPKSAAYFRDLHDHLIGQRDRGIVPRLGEQHAGCLPRYHLQPAERSDETPDAPRNDLHADHIHHGRLRDELHRDALYLELGVMDHHCRHGDHSTGHARLVRQKRLDRWGDG